MSSKILCIYHGNCADGFGAAWAVRHAFRDAVEFHAGFYGKEPPDVAGRDVVLVDFSYKRPVIDAMLRSGDVRQANTILILDHHKTAQADLAGLDLPEHYSPDERRWCYLPDLWRTEWEQRAHWPVRAVFDMERSGAGLAWDFFNFGQPRPRLIDHIEDRDLWRFRLPFTREIQACLFSHPYDFAVWDRLMLSPPEQLARDGMAIERKHHKDIAELVALVKRTMTIGGYAVPVACLPHTLSSDAGNLMAKGERFAACYWDTAEHRIFSLRSTEDGLDVSAIAASYGGGGHKHASGFQVPRDHALASA
jgi:uncharacterized protein